MKTKNILKALALAILMPAMLLTTSCINNEIPKEKGYELPVTINVTRQGDEASTKATYNGTTKKLEFSTGDKLFVSGYYSDGGYPRAFAGTLTWVSEGTFSGTITTQTQWTGTIDALFTAGSATATLLPAGYGTYGFLSIGNDGTYSAYKDYDYTKTFATSKALAIEQFSDECGSYTPGTGFVLNPDNAILNFTITGLTPTTTVAVVVSDSNNNRGGNVTTDGSGTATFAVGVFNKESNQISLTVDGAPITLNLFSGTNTTLAAGHIYNITRSAASGPSYDQTKSINAGDVTVTAGEHWLITGTGDVSSSFITIGDGATVTLDGVKINMGDEDIPCIKCEGSATIILKDGSTNQLVSNNSNYPALWIGDEGTTLTIQGSTGSLTVTSGRYCAGIGGGYSNTDYTCGNIVIEGGIIEATGGEQGAGIGSDNQGICGGITISGGTVTATATGNDGNGGAGIGSGYGSSSCGNIIISGGIVIAECSNAGGAGIGSGKWSSCGNISISGGDITATGGAYAAGIGSGDGYNSTSSCGDITIENTVTSVTATKGNNAPISIGAGDSGTCGTVSIAAGANVTQN